MKTDYVQELTLFYNKDFVIADSYTVIEPALSLFKKDQSITHAELNNYMKDNKDFKLESIMINGKVSSKEKEEFCQDWRIHPTDFNILKSIVSIKDKRTRNKIINNLDKEIPHFKELSKIIREAKRPKEIPPKHYFPWIKF